MSKEWCNFVLSDAGLDSPIIGLFSFTATQHTPLGSFAGLPALRQIQGTSSGYFFAHTPATLLVYNKITCEGPNG